MPNRKNYNETGICDDRQKTVDLVSSVAHNLHGLNRQIGQYAAEILENTDNPKMSSEFAQAIQNLSRQLDSLLEPTGWAALALARQPDPVDLDLEQAVRLASRVPASREISIQGTAFCWLDQTMTILALQSVFAWFALRCGHDAPPSVRISPGKEVVRLTFSTGDHKKTEQDDKSMRLQQRREELLFVILDRFTEAHGTHYLHSIGQSGAMTFDLMLPPSRFDTYLPSSKAFFDASS